MARVVLKNVTKKFKDVVAVDNVSIDIEDKEFAVLVTLTAVARVPPCVRKYPSFNNRLGATIIYVTHDQIEAMTMATRIFSLMIESSSRKDIPWMSMSLLPS